MPSLWPSRAVMKRGSKCITPVITALFTFILEVKMLVIYHHSLLFAVLWRGPSDILEFTWMSIGSVLIFLTADFSWGHGLLLNTFSIGFRVPPPPRFFLHLQGRFMSILEQLLVSTYTCISTYRSSHITESLWMKNYDEVSHCENSPKYRPVWRTYDNFAIGLLHNLHVDLKTSRSTFLSVWH
jgi:hypothetical protein